MVFVPIFKTEGIFCLRSYNTYLCEFLSEEEHHSTQIITAQDHIVRLAAAA